MPQWLAKTFVALVTVLTLGTVVPTVNYHSDTRPSRYDSEGQRTQSEPTEIVIEPASAEVETEAEEKGVGNWSAIAMNCGTKEEMLAQLAQFTENEAKAQGFMKFGDTIATEIGSTYSNEIAPKFADAVASLGAATDADMLRHLAVSHNPAPGTGERILNLYDERTGKEWVKFHVRRDHPPLDGYYFTFHYHTDKDNFQGHHEIGKIYWDKNMPPKWMA
jgi:hypothetical protein